MKQHLQRIKQFATGLTLGVAVLAIAATSVNAAPSASSQQQAAAAPPPSQVASGAQSKPAIAPGTKDAQATEKLGPTDNVKLSLSTGGAGALQAGYVANVDFQSFYNYCWRNLVYTPVKNTTGVTKYLQVKVYNQGAYRDLTTSVAPGATVYPAFYGIDGAYSAYLYVWNGSSYAYDEYLGGTNTCNVAVTRVYNTGGWVQLKIENLGTAYATQISTELAPYPGSGTYTGTQYDYPAAGGAAIYRWFQVGTQPYGITSRTDGSFNAPYMFTGDL